MKPVGHIKDAPWVLHDDLGLFIQQLYGKGVTARLVGGVVRETLLGRFDYNCDLDIAVDVTPGEMIAICMELGIQVIPTGLVFGTVTCILGDKSYEITSLRKDIKTDGRKAVVAYTKDWIEDACRRDLTINALYADWDGHYYDPTGKGIDDLNHRYLRFIGNPRQRIQEDFLRIVRFFRFMGLFPHPKYDGVAYQACISLAKHLNSISQERKWSELQKIFQSKYPLNAIESLIASKIMLEVCRINWSLNKLERSMPWVQNYFEDIFFYILGGVNHFSIDRTNCLPVSLQKRLVDVFNAPFRSRFDLKDLYWAGRAVYKDAYIQHVIVTQDFSPEALEKCKEEITKIDACLIPKFPVSGVDLQELGFTPGPLMGAVLKDTEKWWVESDFKPDFNACLKRIQSLHLKKLKDNI
jgi:poly(A) polymerase